MTGIFTILDLKRLMGNFSQIRCCSLCWLPAKHVVAPCSPQVLDLHTMQTWGRGGGVCVWPFLLCLFRTPISFLPFLFPFHIFFFFFSPLFHTLLTERFPFFHPCCVARICFLIRFFLTQKHTLICFECDKT